MPQNLQWLYSQIAALTLATPAITDAEIITAVNALRLPNAPIPNAVLSPMIQQTTSWDNLLALSVSSAAGQLQLLAIAALHAVDGNAPVIDITAPTVDKILTIATTTTMPGSLPAAMIMPEADYLAILELAQPLIAGLNGWDSGVAETDLTNARAWNATSQLTLQVQSGYNAAMAMIVPGSTLPTASALQAAFAAKVTG